MSFLYNGCVTPILDPFHFRKRMLKAEIGTHRLDMHTKCTPDTLIKDQLIHEVFSAYINAFLVCVTEIQLSNMHFLMVVTFEHVNNLA